MRLSILTSKSVYLELRCANSSFGNSISTNTAESTSPKDSREDTPPARPKYSSKRPSRLAGLLGDEGSKSGVDTPDRFFFPHKQGAAGPLSPGAFASALDRGLTQLTALEEGEKASSHSKDKGQAPLHQEEVGQRDHMTEPADLLHPAGHSIPAGRRGLLPGRLRGDEDRSDLKTPKPSSASRAKRETDSPDNGERLDGEDQIRGRTKAFAFYGQVSPGWISVSGVYSRLTVRNPGRIRLLRR